MECTGKHEGVKANDGSIEQHRNETMWEDIQPRWVGMRSKAIGLSEANFSRCAWYPHPLYCLFKDIIPSLLSLILHWQFFSVVDHSSHHSNHSNILRHISQLKLTNKMLLLHYIRSLLHTSSFPSSAFRKTLWKTCLHSLSPLLIPFLEFLPVRLSFLPLQNLFSQDLSILHIAKSNDQLFLSLPLTRLLANLTHLITPCFLKVSGTSVFIIFFLPYYVLFLVNLLHWFFLPLHDFETLECSSSGLGFL